MKKNIIVIADILNNKIQPITYEVIACAESIAIQESSTISVIIINAKPAIPAEELSQTSNHKIISIKTPYAEHYNSHVYKIIIADTISDLRPWFICSGHTAQGIDFAPGLAAKLNYACITSVNGLSKTDDTLTFSRSLFGGKLNAFIKSSTETTVLTIQPGAFKKSENSQNTGSIINKTSNETPQQIISTGLIKPDANQSDLNDAKTVIAFGRGILEPENMPLVEKFSLLFSDSSIACSRPVVDMGWMKYKHQVGITGAIISPEVYIACGISGSSQHIAGMSNSDFVIAINNDPNAAIFNFADICIVEDLFCFFAAFEENLRL